MGAIDGRLVNCFKIRGRSTSGSPDSEAWVASKCTCSLKAWLGVTEAWTWPMEAFEAGFSSDHKVPSTKIRQIECWRRRPGSEMAQHRAK